MIEAELLVLGAGPAGMGAAIEASRAGVDALIVDEASSPGGQVYRALPAEFRRHGPAPAEAARGEALADELRRSGARMLFGTRAYGVAPGFRVDTVGPDGPLAVGARALVAATGTHERVIPFPGWTLPGVIGLAAATILLKSQQMLPGERVVVAGCGPLLAAVAVGIVKGGGRVAAVVDLAGPDDWLRALPAMVGCPDLLVRGLGWIAALKRAGVPFFFRHTVTAALGNGSVAEVEISPVGGGATRAIAADALSVGHGLVPDTALTRLLRARHLWRPERGGWIAERDAEFRTSVHGLFLAGDGGGVSGAAAAELQGRLAGRAAARDLGRSVPDDAGLRRALARAERFGGAMSHLMAPRPEQAATIAAATTVCRCEDVTRGEIEAAIETGATEVNQLKAWTRCGMGPCQGRMCGEAAASLVAARVGGREAAGLWTGRSPLRPVSLEALTGAYDYADIPIPKAAPL